MGEEVSGSDIIYPLSTVFRDFNAVQGIKITNTTLVLEIMS